jgi:hypothetical protein
MRLQIALAGSLRETLAAEMAAGERATSAAMRATVGAVKAELRAQVTGAGLGARLARTWRGDVYPRAGDSLRAAGSVTSKAPKIVRAFDEGAVIRSANGLWLAIPTENAPKKGLGGKRITPSNFPEHVFGPLRFVYLGRAKALLVADGLRARRGKRGGFARATDKARASGRGLATAVMFVLVPQVRLRKRLDFLPVAQAAGDALPGLIVRLWEAQSRRA